MFAVLPFGVGFAAFTAFNLLGCAALPWYSQRALLAQERAYDPSGHTEAAFRSLPPMAVMVLAVALTASEGSMVGILFVGQLSVLEALVLVAALDARGRDRPGLAGLLLSIATVKIATMLPFLLLFLRKSDLRTWVGLAVGCLALLAMTGHVWDLPGNYSVMAGRVARLGCAGQVNDYSFRRDSALQHDRV